jgi:hypothetical protein
MLLLVSKVLELGVTFIRSILGVSLRLGVERRGEKGMGINIKVVPLARGQFFYWGPAKPRGGRGCKKKSLNSSRGGPHQATTLPN